MAVVVVDTDTLSTLCAGFGCLESSSSLVLSQLGERLSFAHDFRSMRAAEESLGGIKTV